MHFPSEGALVLQKFPFSYGVVPNAVKILHKPGLEQPRPSKKQLLVYSEQMASDPPVVISEHSLSLQVNVEPA